MSHLVLIADDNADNILLLKRILRRSDIDCQYIDAQSGREVLKLAAEKHPEVIFLDLKMPDMDGYKTAAALKADGSTRDIPVIAVTAQAMMGDMERALEAGCDEYMMKPVDPVLLVETLRKHLSGKPAGH